MTVLSEPVDWVSLACDRLAALSDRNFVGGTRRIMVDGVEPKTFLLHEEPGRFRIVLNHFDRVSFAHHRKEGRITPHFHRFSFATRVLHGHYHHLLYDNEGAVTCPQLTLRYQTRDDINRVYYLPWDRYHCVLAPARDTVSLQIRGVPQFASVSRPTQCSDTDLLEARDAAYRALKEAALAEPSRGHVPDFFLPWLDSPTSPEEPSFFPHPIGTHPLRAAP